MTTLTTDPITDWRAWRAARDAHFGQPYGWLSLTALHWFGTRREPLDSLPGLWWLESGGVHYQPVPGGAGPVLVDGSAVTDPTVLWRPGSGPAPDITHGERRLELISRGLGMVGVRVRDPQAPALQSYRGVPAFDYDPRWRVNSSYRRYPTATRIPVGSAAIGVSQDTLIAGELDLVVDGVPHTLKVTADGLLSFRDASNGRETTHHCRWIELGDDLGESVVVDFNLAANPPCAFTDYGTCPLAPAGNDISLPVLAGERDPHRAS